MVCVVSMESKSYDVSLEFPYNASFTLGCCQEYLTIVPSGSKDSAPDMVKFSPATTWSGMVIRATGGLPVAGVGVGIGILLGGGPLYVPALMVKFSLNDNMLPSAVTTGLANLTVTVKV
ncbi:hypothetical protein D3C80_1849000 [compost metagenome]